LEFAWKRESEAKTEIKIEIKMKQNETNFGKMKYKLKHCGSCIKKQRDFVKSVHCREGNFWL